jgi:inner membrane transporter RhtA
MFTGAAGSQVGAAVGAHAFPAIGPAGVVAVRQFVAAAVLLPVARPDLRRFTWTQWWPTLALGGVYAAMNLALYGAVSRIGLALAVTLEFLGPLAIALLGSRTGRDVACAVAAAVGVYVLVLPGSTNDYLGIAFALAAAACWAAYIVLNRLVGARLPGLQAPAAASGVAALLYLPVAVLLFAQGRMTSTALACAVGAGLLSSALTYAAEFAALRRVSPRFYSVFMSAHPVLAAVAGLVVLGQHLVLHQWLGIAIVAGTNAVTVTRAC